MYVEPMRGRRGWNILIRLSIIIALLVTTSAAVSAPVAEATGSATGHFDGFTTPSSGDQTLHVVGWVLNSSHPSDAIHVRLIVGGSVLPLPSPGYLVANEYRPDVGAAYPCCGNYHGIDQQVVVPFGVNVPVCLQADIHGSWQTFGPCKSYSLTLDAMRPTTTLNGPCADSTLANPNYGCHTDNAGLYYCFESTFTPAMRTGVTDAMTYSYNTTELDTHAESCVYTGGGETDIVFQSRGTNYFPTGAYATTWCNDAETSTKCDQAYVTYNYDKTLSFTPAEMRKEGCHETAHVVGFVHGTGADPIVSSTAPAMQCIKVGFANLDYWLGAHHASYVNLTY